MRRSALAISVALVAGWCGSATATPRVQPVESPPNEFFVGPVLTSDGAAWAREGRDLRLYQTGGTGHPTELLKLNRTPGRSVRAGLASGPGFLALGYGQFGSEGPPNGPEDRGSDNGLLTVTGGGRSLAPSGCAFLCSDRLVDSDGSRVASVVAAPRASGRELDTLITDHATGTSKRLPIDGSYGRLAGRFLLYNAYMGALVVYDWQAETEVFRVPGVVAGLGNAGSSERADLQADGTIVFSPASTEGLATASPAAPTPRLLPVASGSYSGFSLVGDTVIARHSRDFHRHAASVETIEAIDLKRGRATLLASEAASDDGTAFDGQRAAFFAFSCSGRRIVIGSVADIATSSLAKRHICRLTLTSKPRLRGTGASVSYRCKPFGRDDCDLVYAAAATTRDYRLGGRTIRRGVLIGYRGRSRNGRLTLTLTRTGRRLVRRHHVRVRVTADAYVGDGGGFQKRVAVTTLGR